MNDQIITVVVSVIVSGFSLTGTIIGAKAGIREANRLTVYRLQELERKVDKHNNLVERMVKVEKGLGGLNDKLTAYIEHADQKLDACMELADQKLTDRGKLTDERLGTLAQRLTAIIAGDQRI